MEQNILISKIASTATETGWSQAYSTHYLYMVMSIKNETEGIELAAVGKEFVEKLQREFFALPEKNLTHIKKAVETSIGVFPEGSDYSIVVATILSDILYIVTVSESHVLMRRGGKYFVIATGTPGQIHGFSGKIKHSDIVILETADFSRKIPFESIEGISRVDGVLDLSESIAPLIHGETLGTEAAIFLQYQHFAQPEQKTPIETPAPLPSTPRQEPFLPNQVSKETPLPDPINEYSTSNTSRFSLPHIPFGKRTVLFFIIVILLLALGINIYREQQKRQGKKENEALIQVLKPAEDKYKEGLELKSLNEVLALEDLKEAESMLTKQDSQFPKNSEARVEYDKLLGQIRQSIQEFEGGSAVTTTILFDPTKSTELKGVTAVTKHGENLAVTDSTSQKAATLTDSGSIDNTFSIDSGKLNSLSGNENVLLVASLDGIYQVDKKGSSGKIVIEETGLSSVNVFGTNVYATNGTTINKYGGEGFSKSSYFQGNPNLSSISDFAIDGAIWVIEANGKIHKFLRGKEETFSVKGLPVTIGKDPKIYTDQDFKNLYILDPTNKKILVIDKEGTYKSSYMLTLSNISSFAIDEASGTGYVAAGNKLYSFRL